MSHKLTSILKDIEDVRTFTDESYLSTSYFVVFLLFGCNDEQRGLLGSKANKLIADRQAFAMIDAAGAADVVRGVEEAIEKVADEHIEVEDLNEMHFCPVIVSETADTSTYCEIISAVNNYIKKRDIQPVWKSFLLLDTLSENAASWLDTVSAGIASLGEMHSCRCCVLTRKDEKGFAVAEERLLTTVLFVAFLHVVKETREEIGRYIGVSHDNPMELFYTAQTVFVENPVITRIFTRMSGLLFRLSKHTAASQFIDMSFINDILKSAYDRMPQDRGYISLLPVYCVMPDENLEDFKKRLKNFAMGHYLAFAQDDKGRSAAFAQIASGFLRACVKSGLGIEDLVSLIGNTEEIEKLSGISTQGVAISELPPYPGSGRYSRDVSEIFEMFQVWLRRQIMNIGSELLKEYFRSDEFAALPRKYKKVQEKLEEEINDMNRIRNQRKKLDTALRLLNDPDEKWLDTEYESTVIGFVQHFSHMALAKDDEAFEVERSELLDKLYQASKGLSGGNGARSYMRLVSDTCADAGSDLAKSCVKAIGDALRFPIRVSGNFGGGVSCTYVWGSEENNLYKVWEKYHTIIETRSVELPIKSNERFAFLRVSSSFSRAKILSVMDRHAALASTEGDTGAAERDAARQTDEMPEPADVVTSAARDINNAAKVMDNAARVMDAADDAWTGADDGWNDAADDNNPVPEGNPDYDPEQDWDS